MSEMLSTATAEVATITRPPLRQLRLELWQPEAGHGNWHGWAMAATAGCHIASGLPISCSVESRAAYSGAVAERGSVY